MAGPDAGARRFIQWTFYSMAGTGTLFLRNGTKLPHDFRSLVTVAEYGFAKPSFIDYAENFHGFPYATTTSRFD